MKLGKLIVFENTKSCSYCKRIETVLNSAEFKKFLSKCGAALVRADAGTDSKGYAKLKAQYKFSGQYPTFFAVDGDGKTLGRFVARGYTAKKLIAAVEELCPDCCDDVACESVPCPACGGTGRVPGACAD